MWMAGVLGALTLAAPATGGQVAEGSIYHPGRRPVAVGADAVGGERGYEVIRAKRGARRTVVRRLAHRDREAPQLITDFAASRRLIALSAPTRRTSTRACSPPVARS